MSRSLSFDAGTFWNCGMRTSLANNLNLTGTARYNRAIRHKLRLRMTHENTRKKIPASWEGVVAYFNHTELDYINKLAIATGVKGALPFQRIEWLPPDNGERFFSEYLLLMTETSPPNDEEHRCICQVCGPKSKQMTQPASPPVPQPQPPPVNTTTEQPMQQVMNDPPQQQQQQQPMVQYPHQHSMPMNPTYFPMPTQMPNFLPQFTPWMLAPVQRPLFCCSRYRDYINSPVRRGRLPHDYHCATRTLGDGVGAHTC